MAKGSQDWVQRTDAFLQSLTQVVTRNTYGGARLSAVAGAVAANAATTVVSLTGKGQLLSVYFRASSTATMDNDRLKITVDGQDVSLPVFGKFRDYNWDRGAISSGIVSIFNDTDFVVGGTAGLGITFETTYVLAYEETYGRNPTAELSLLYALVGS